MIRCECDHVNVQHVDQDGRCLVEDCECREFTECVYRTRADVIDADE